MGVKGLWQLLQPVARPVKIETLEGKKLAIDSSIWMYQFQATMKDKQGRTLVNAHILGFIRRINKLLFHGIKPVFVFDGAAPALKRSTIAERKQRKSGVAASHVKVAEKIFNAQLRREAIRQAQEKRALKRSLSAVSAPISDPEDDTEWELDSNKERNENEEQDTGAIIPKNAVFLDDYDQPPRRDSHQGPPPSEASSSRSRPTPRRRRRSSLSSSSDESADQSVDPSPITEGKTTTGSAKKKYVVRDPYQLPDLPGRSMHSDRQDPRIATEAELREFIDEMKYDDIDTASSDFKLLPAEVQYEIINDLRLRSRSSSHLRLQSMLTSSKTPLDFSKAQIKNLQARNVLTQQMWGLAGIESQAASLDVKVRMANEKNREYVLMKNEQGGGWVLGIREEGTKEKPIDLEEEEEDLKTRIERDRKIREGEGRRKRRKLIKDGVLLVDQDESSGEEDEAREMDHRRKVPLEDNDFRKHRRQAALEALSDRYSPLKAQKSTSRSSQITGKSRSTVSAPLFVPSSEDDEVEQEEEKERKDAMEAVRLAEDEDEDLQRALRLSRQDNREETTNVKMEEDAPVILGSDEDEDEDMEEVPLENAVPVETQPGLIPSDKRSEPIVLSSEPNSEDVFEPLSDGLFPEGILSVEGSSSTTYSPTPPPPEDPIRPLSPLSIARKFSGLQSLPSASPRTPGGPKRSVSGSSAGRPAPSSFSKSHSLGSSRKISDPLITPRPSWGFQKRDSRTEEADDNQRERSSGSLSFRRSSHSSILNRETPLASRTSGTNTLTTPTPTISHSFSHQTFPTEISIATPSRPILSPHKRIEPEEELFELDDSFELKDEFKVLASTGNQEKVDTSSAVNEMKGSLGGSLGGRSVHFSAHSVSPTSSNIQQASPLPHTDRPESLTIDSTLDFQPTVYPFEGVQIELSSSPASDVAPVVSTENDHIDTFDATPDARGPSLSNSPSHVSRPGFVQFPSGGEKEESDSSLGSSPPISIHEIADEDQSLGDSPDKSFDRSFSAPPSDAEDESIDMNAEEDGYARFLSQVKGKDLAEVQAELDREIDVLNAQRRKLTAGGDENVSVQMTSQIQVLLRLYGIPYVTAPMEAEAQCAELASLGLVDGVITDDSDVFLFGAKTCFKNLFNDHKYVECYVSGDISRELCLDRDRLISLAFLLGSDYTPGIPGVGYVSAMEVLAEFPGNGDDGLIEFRNWWLKVQTGKDTEAETNTKWKKSFKKKHKADLHLTVAEFPNRQVRPAYLSPTVDSSTEPFAWGFPNLDQLRVYLAEELSWSVSKVDDELLPIVQRIARRGQGVLAGTNRQGTLDGFFDVSGGRHEVFAPRVKNAYPSKRMQSVLQRFRESIVRLESRKVSERRSEEEGEMEGEVEESSDLSSDSGSDGQLVNQRSIHGKGRGRGNGRGRGKSGGRGKTIE